jgi:hypothetical protein
MVTPRVVLLLGAGASVADVAGRSLVSRPPLDRRFFAFARKTHKTRVDEVARYMRDTYELDILSPTYDSLEGVMGLLYPDLFNPSLEAKALPTFRSLLRLFTARLASTTNNIEATQKRFLYRMLCHYLGERVEPGAITIITFNQDIQVEKVLELLSNTARWHVHRRNLFCFPHLYSIGGRWAAVTAPTRGQRDCFRRSQMARPDCLRVLKLHGSLNWYSSHRSEDPSPAMMFRIDRSLRVTRRRTIDPSMRMTRGRDKYTWPVIVPPVNHKSAVLHDGLKEVWRLAEERIADADELVVFGYSCPALDFESSNMLRRANRKRRKWSRTVVVDPDGAVAARYIGLLEPEQLDYFPNAKSWLAHL